MIASTIYELAQNTLDWLRGEVIVLKWIPGDHHDFVNIEDGV